MIKWFVVSMKRSGHHAIMEWIIKGIGGEWLHYNCCHPTYENTIIPTNGNWVIHTNVNRTDKTCVTTDYHKKRPLDEIETLHKDVDDRIYNFEDYTVNDILKYGEMHNADRVVLIARDYYNMMASSLAWAFNFPQEHSGHYTKCFVKRTYMWIEHMSHVDDDRLTFINYNSWVSSQSYRDKMALELGFLNNNWGIESVPNFGHGSSFEATTKDGKASEMKVFTRHQVFELEEYNKFLKGVDTKQLTEICNRNFGTEYIYGAD